MGLHRGVAYYAVCDHGRDYSGQPDATGTACVAFVAPARDWDPQAPGALLVQGASCFADAQAAGWLVPHGDGGDRWLCPAHRPKVGR